MKIRIPPDALILAVGGAGAGKSTFISKHFPNDRVSSDHCRLLICGDETSQEYNRAAYLLMHDIIRARMVNGILCVADATNLKARDRKSILDLGRDFRPSVALIFDTPLDRCISQNAGRDRKVPEDVVRNHYKKMQQAKVDVRTEVGAYYVIYPDMEYEIVREDPSLVLYYDDVAILGDVHGCADELRMAIQRLPNDMKIVFVGDLADRGPKSLEVLRIVHDLVKSGRAIVVKGNHDWKLERYLKGNPIKLSHGLQETVNQFMGNTSAQELEEFHKMLAAMPHYVTIHCRGRTYTVSHAGMPFDYLGRKDKKVTAHCMYGETDGTPNEEGFPNRTYSWRESWKDEKHLIIHGHDVVQAGVPMKNGNVINIDTGCCFGGSLSVYRTDSRGDWVMQIPALEKYAEHGRDSNEV